MKKWCGIKKFLKNGKYQVIVPALSEYIADDLMIYDSAVSGRALTKQFISLEEAKEACIEFNQLHEKYS